MGRIRQASKQFDIRLPLFHLPGATGPMGAAVASAHLMGLPSETLRRALGIVASRCAGLWPNNGTHTKSSHCGLASANGLDAAMLAERGYTGNPNIFEASRGYVAAFFDEDDFDWDHLLRFGDPYKVIEPGYAIKMFPSQYVTHFVIAGTQELRDKVADPGQLEELIVHGPRIDYIDRPFPESGLAGKFSYQYAAACTWLDGTVTMNSYTDARRFAPDMEMMLKRTRLNPRPDISAVLGERYVEIEAKLKDGRTEIVRCDGPPGCFGKPKIPPEKHLDKVRDCLATKLAPAQIERVIDYGGRLETLSGAEIGTLMGILRAA
jgi:aconitate decarboxylase